MSKMNKSCDVEMQAEKEPSMQDIFRCLRTFQAEMKKATNETNMNLELTNKNLEMTNKNLRGMEDKIEAIKLDMETKENDSVSKFTALKNRLQKIEEGVKRSDFHRMKKNKLTQMEQNVDDQPMGRTRQMNQNQKESAAEIMSSTSNSFQPTWAKSLELELAEAEASGREAELEHSKEMENKKRKQKMKDREEANRAAEEARKVNQRRKEGQQRLEKERSAAKRMEGEIQRGEFKDDKTSKQGMRKIKKWFGDETESDPESSESDISGDDTWSQIERKKRNKLKKKKSEKNKKEKQTMNATKASHILGLSPIYTDSVNSYTESTKTYEEAKINAVKEYLNEKLKFNDEELEDMKLKETMISAKGDHTIYVAFQDIEHIKEIHRRMAECGNEDLSSRNYIPPGFFDRYMTINKKCQEYRKDNPSYKTQIRFGAMDVEVYLKERGSAEPYRKVNMEDLMGTDELPAFDHTRKWQMRLDRPPRRKVNYDSTVQDPLASHRLNNKHQLSRQSSSNSVDNNKRQKNYEEGGEMSDTPSN